MPRDKDESPKTDDAPKADRVPIAPSPTVELATPVANASAIRASGDEVNTEDDK